MMKYDYLNRLVKFAGDIIIMVDNLPKTVGFKHLSNQVVRSASSAALNFGETQGAVSNKDYLNKAGIALKELLETEVNLRIMNYVHNSSDNIMILNAECVELIKICKTIIRNKKVNIWQYAP